MGHAEDAGDCTRAVSARRQHAHTARPRCIRTHNAIVYTLSTHTPVVKRLRPCGRRRHRDCSSVFFSKKEVGLRSPRRLHLLHCSRSQRHPIARHSTHMYTRFWGGHVRRCCVGACSRVPAGLGGLGPRDAWNVRVHTGRCALAAASGADFDRRTEVPVFYKACEWNVWQVLCRGARQQCRARQWRAAVLFPYAIIITLPSHVNVCHKLVCRTMFADRDRQVHQLHLYRHSGLHRITQSWGLASAGGLYAATVIQEAGRCGKASARSCVWMDLGIFPYFHGIGLP